MDYKVKFKKLEKGKEPEKDYKAIREAGLQYQGLPKGKGVPQEIMFAEGIFLGKICSGYMQDAVVPKGRTLEVTFKEE